MSGEQTQSCDSNLLDIRKRTKEMLCIGGWSIFILAPVELARIAVGSVSIPILLIGWPVEYIATGHNKWTEKYAYMLENGGKKEVENMGRKCGIECRIY
jgi:hypothetical protein